MGLRSGNKVNEVPASVPSNHSTYDLSHHIAGTYRFGEISPFLSGEIIRKDDFSIRLAHRVNSFTLKSPLMHGLQMKKALFSIPLSAVLPLNYQKVIQNPVSGDDVDDKVNSYVSDFSNLIRTKLVALNTRINSLFTTATAYTNDSHFRNLFVGWMMNLIYHEMFYSKGSLASSLGYNLHPLFIPSAMNWLGTATDVVKYPDFDSMFDSIIDYWLSLWDNEAEADRRFTIHVFPSPFTDGPSYHSDYKAVTVAIGNPTDGEISFREFLNLIRSGVIWTLNSTLPTAVKQGMILQSGEEGAYTYSGIVTFTASISSNSVPLNVGIFASYGMLCAQFFSNDKVDGVYTAELWRENLLSIMKMNSNLKSDIEGDTYGKFTYNGISCSYDMLSGQIMTRLLTRLFTDLQVNDASANPTLFTYWMPLVELFQFQRSLRYADYFTTGKTSPLAVGETTIAVNNNAVSVIDISKSIVYQRFLNAVNRTAKNFQSYVQTIFKTTPPENIFEPKFIALENFNLFPEETTNTGSDQLTKTVSVTSTLRAEDQNRQVNVSSNDQGFVIGVVYYDVVRFYGKSIERYLTHKDRYEMYNPSLENVGDQEIRRYEKNPILTDPASPFAYVPRYAEYRQMISRSFGGFNTNALPSWIFLADEGVQDDLTKVIDSEYIRSRQSELDKFYVGFAGWSLGNYFHFIVDNANIISASRPISFAPTIL